MSNSRSLASIRLLAKYGLRGRLYPRGFLCYEIIPADDKGQTGTRCKYGGVGFDVGQGKRASLMISLRGCDENVCAPSNSPPPHKRAKNM